MNGPYRVKLVGGPEDIGNRDIELPYRPQRYDRVVVLPGIAHHWADDDPLPIVASDRFGPIIDENEYMRVRFRFAGQLANGTLVYHYEGYRKYGWDGKRYYADAPVWADGIDRCGAECTD